MKRAISALLLTAAALFTGPAGADPYRLRADAYYSTPDPNAGLLVLSGEARAPTWVEAEAVVWVGTGDYPADVLIAAVRAHDPGGYGDVRVGRMLLTTGAIRPLHLDGADVIARAPWGSSVEVFGGVPVSLEYGAREYDWAVGGRASQRIGKDVTAGLSYVQTRTGGAVAFEELGIDTAAVVTSWLDGAVSGSLDLARPGLTDARVSLAAKLGPMRLEAFALRRSPSHLLPATSLFAALGDIPSQRAGGSFLWRAAPRLDVSGEAAIESLGGELGGQFMLRTILRLDDRGDGALALEGRRQSTPDASWTGVRATARVPLGRMFTASTELELAAPDNPTGKGVVWPWGLVALGFKPIRYLELAAAMEASSSPTRVGELAGIFRVSGMWGSRR